MERAVKGWFIYMAKTLKKLKVPKEKRIPVKVRTQKIEPMTEKNLPWYVIAYLEILKKRCTGDSLFSLVPDLPKSLNHQYKHGRHPITKKPMKFLDPTITTFRSVVNYSVRGKKFNPTGVIGCLILCESPEWLTLDNTVRISDLDNRIKATLDALVHSHVKLEDERAWEHHIFKIKSKYKRTWIWLFDLGDIVEIFG